MENQLITDDIMTSFSIIALKVLSGNPNNIRKILPEGETWYLFNQLYKVEKNKLKRNENYQLSDDFFGKNISINAIVGKNGSGKSSLLEFMFRMINNLTFWLTKKQQRNAAEHFYYIEDLYGDLYFVINDKLCVLHCRGNFVGLKVDGCKWGFNFPYNKKQSIPSEFKSYEIKDEVLIREFVEISKTFFYTIVTNYSLQAFLDSDYTERCGHFDSNGKSGYDSAGIWINSMFHKNDGYSAPIVLNPYRDEGVINLTTEYQLTNQRLVAIFIESKKKGKQFIDNYQLNNIKYNYDPTIILRKYSSYYKKQEDLHRDFINSWNHDNDKIETYTSCVLKQFGYTFPSNIGELSNLQIDAYIYLVYKTLNIASKYPSYSKYSEIVKELTPKEKAEAKEKCDKLSYITEYRDGATRVTQEAPQEIKKIANTIKPLFQKQVDLEIQTLLEDLVLDILKDKSHITLKITQTLNFLKECDIQKLSKNAKKNSDFTYNDYINTLKSRKELRGLSEIMEFLPPPFFEYEITLDKMDKGEIISNKDNPIPFKTMSSGEKQFLYAVSTLTYHIKNLRSIQQTHRVKYRHINVVLDEIELCFHPEYQRKFIDKLIDTIKRLQLNNRCAINIILATHSPFILSDIPNCNILYLQEGQQIKDVCIEPFGANIHDILTQSFFLENGFIGEFAQKKIGEVIEVINKKKVSQKRINADDYKKYKKVIDLIGEPLIKNKLMNMISEVYDNTQDRIKMLEDEIEILRNKER